MAPLIVLHTCLLTATPISVRSSGWWFTLLVIKVHTCTVTQIIAQHEILQIKLPEFLFSAPVKILTMMFCGKRSTNHRKYEKKAQRIECGIIEFTY